MPLTEIVYLTSILLIVASAKKKKKKKISKFEAEGLLKNDHVSKLILGSSNQFGFNRFSRLLVHVYSIFVW